MAYYSNYPDYSDNYQYNPYLNQPNTLNYNNNYEPNYYVQSYNSYSNYNMYHSEFPAHKTSNAYDLVSTENVASYSITDPQKNDQDLSKNVALESTMLSGAPNDVPPFHGGYNMSETYGKPLPPSDEICYPPSKIDPKSNLADFSNERMDQNIDTKSKPANDGKKTEENGKSSVLPQNKEDQKNSEKIADSKVPAHIETAVASETKTEEDKEDEGGDEDEEEAGNIIDDRQTIRRQIPPDYGLEAMDLCEGVFGGYFPCLWKKSHGMSTNNINNNQSNNYNEMGYDQGDCWRNTADYFFGNPNPYGGDMQEKGSYGDPIYSYQRRYPTQPVYGQVDQYSQNYQCLPNPRYY